MKEVQSGETQLENLHPLVRDAGTRLTNINIWLLFPSRKKQKMFDFSS